MNRLSHALLLTLGALLPGAQPAQSQHARAPGVDYANVHAQCDSTILLPEPAGHHQVGTVTYHWVDTARMETLSPDPHDQRQVMATVFYPGVRAWDGPAAEYVPELDLLRQGFRTDSRELPKRIADEMASRACVATFSFPAIPVDSSEEHYPIAVFSPGGNMSRHWHTALAQELASEGWVVAVLSHAYSGMDVFPAGGFIMSSDYWNAPEDATPADRARLDDEQAQMLAGDASFTLDRLAELASGETSGLLSRRLDLERIAIIGHSRGGSTVGRACATDRRFGACVVYDNIGADREVRSGLPSPQLTIRQPWPEARAATLAGYLTRNAEVSYDVVIEGAGHMSFSDLPFVEPERTGASIDAARAHRIVSDVTLAFLDAHVRGGGDPGEVARAVARYPEAALEMFGRSADGGGERIPSVRSATPDADAAQRFAQGRRLADSLGTDAYILMVDGEVVDAYGDVAHEYRLHSVRKSLLGTLYGVALARGAVDTTRTLAEIGIDDDTPLTAAERQARIVDLLASRSGVFLPATHENEGFDDVRPGRGSRAPGEAWFYSNWDFNAAGTAYQIMAGESLHRAFARDIGEAIGMRDFTVEDGAWRYGSRSRHPAYVFRMSARDLARFGQLLLQEGRWEGRQVVPAAWIERVTAWRSQATRPDGEVMPGVGYGLSWWLSPPEEHGVELGEGAFSASGTGGQLLVVAPKLNLVFVHRNDTDVPSDAYRSINVPEAYDILRALLGAR